MKRYSASVVGGGAGGRLSLDALRASERYEPLAAADISPAARDALSQDYPGIAVFDSHMAMFQQSPTDFGWIRSRRVLIRGERGEIANDTVRYLRDFRTPMSADLRRDTTGANGNLEGFSLRGIAAGGEWVYWNPFAAAPLSDDELAVATCLTRMDEYVRTGRESYSLAEACQDHYLNLLYQQAVREGQEIRGEPQEWTD